MSDLAYLQKQLYRTDTELYGLPHPKIVKLVGTFMLLSSALGDKGFAELSQLMRLLDYPKGELIGRAASSSAEIQKLSRIGGKNGQINMAALELFLAPLRFFTHEGRIFEVTSELDNLLALTDIGEHTPIEFFKLPFTSTYLHFGARAAGLEITAQGQEPAALMGAYITELHLQHPEEVKEAELFLQWTGTSHALTCFEITLVGFPHKTIADHSCLFLRLYVGEKMNEMTVGEVLDLNFEYHKASGTYGTTAEQQQQLKDGITHLTKVLLFINSQSVRRETVLEESVLAARLKSLGTKKQGKVKRRMERAYDRITISMEASSEASQDESARVVRAHWRRGHFRHQRFGAARAQSKLLWIRPMRVGTLKTEASPAKEYTVRGSGHKNPV